MNIDKFKTLENKLSAAYKNNNLLLLQILIQLMIMNS